MAKARCVLTVFACNCLALRAAFAQAQLAVSISGDGSLSWTNIDRALHYTIEWRSSLTDSNAWRGSSRCHQDVKSEDPIVVVPIPMFFRVVASTNPTHTEVLSPLTTVVRAGYYEATDLARVDARLASTNIRAGVTVFGVTGSRAVVDTSSSTAKPIELLSQRTAWVNGTRITGTMPDRGTVVITPGLVSQPIEQGYHDGAGYVEGDMALMPNNIRSGVTVFGVSGNPNVVNTASGNAAATQILTGVKAWVRGAEVTGTMPRRTLDPATNRVQAGFYSEALLNAVDTDLSPANIRSGALVFGIGGNSNVVNTASGNAQAQHIVTGRKAWVRGSEVVGSLSSRVLSPFTDTVAPGYYDATTLRTVDPDLTPANIRAGAVIFGVVGTYGRDAPTNVLAGMVAIPGGTFLMGDSLDGISVPAHYVTLRSFYIGKYEVTKPLWDEVMVWAVANGYDFNNVGAVKSANHPVYNINWYDCVKWCNARSEKEGLIPVYYTADNHQSLYRRGYIDLGVAAVDWDANGYRLPTEAEWEYAARGGVSERRFPWADADTIHHSRANYCADNAAYDTNPGTGYHPDYSLGSQPYTSPVGNFPANGYGLHDMAGNVWEWCWDVWASYGAFPVANPRGPVAGWSQRVYRGGSWSSGGGRCRVAARGWTGASWEDNCLGVRVVRTCP